MPVNNSILIRNLCIAIIILFCFTGIFANFLANNKDILVVVSNQEVYFFPLHQIDSTVFNIAPLITYGPQSIDASATGAIPPLYNQTEQEIQMHYLGTDLLGRDVLAALIHGSRTSLMIGFLSIFLAGLIGILIGGLAGYFGDGSLKISSQRLILQSKLSILLLIYLLSIQKVAFKMDLINDLGAFAWRIVLNLVIYYSFLVLFHSLFKKMEEKFKWKKKAFAVDIYLSRLIEIVSSLPVLFLIIALSALLRPSIWNVILIIGFTAWTSIARFTRSELLSIKKQDYIMAAHSLGIPSFSIFWKHALPNALPTILVTLTFALGGAILAESTLSFLGVGLPPEKASWGATLAMARQVPSAWWLSVFPAMAIFLVIFSCNYLGRYYSNYNKK